MADGVIIRIEGDDAPFQKTLAGIEPAVQRALRGISASAAEVVQGISAQMEAADFAGAGAAALDGMATGMRGNPAAYSAALTRVLERPVTRRVLYFLHTGMAVEV